MQKYKNILITGANSFLGTNVALELAARGIKARAIVRHSNAVLDSIAGLELVFGRVDNPTDLLQAAQGCDCIVHIAAITDQSLPRYEMYRKFNVTALENVISTARAANISRVVFVSSANTIGNGTPSAPADETFKPQPPYSKMLYGRSKVEAEAVLRRADDLNWTILNPTFMLGAYDSKPSSGAIIMMGYARRVIFATPGGKNIVSVEAAARALCNAIECGRRGENYLLSGVNISIRDFFRTLNPTATIIVVPNFLLIAAGYLGDLMRLCGIHTQLSSNNMRVVCTMEYYSSAKAEAELGLQKTSIPDAIAKAVKWFDSQGMLKCN